MRAVAGNPPGVIDGYGNKDCSACTESCAEFKGVRLVGVALAVWQMVGVNGVTGCAVGGV